MKKKKTLRIHVFTTHSFLCLQNNRGNWKKCSYLLNFHIKFYINSFVFCKQKQKQKQKNRDNDNEMKFK